MQEIIGYMWLMDAANQHASIMHMVDTMGKSMHTADTLQ